MRFLLHAYIDRSTTTVSSEEIERKFSGATASGSHSWEFRSDQKDRDRTSPENKGGLLGFRAWAKTETKDGAIRALADLAIWIHKNAFSTDDTSGVEAGMG